MWCCGSLAPSGSPSIEATAASSLTAHGCRRSKSATVRRSPLEISSAVRGWCSISRPQPARPDNLPVHRPGPLTARLTHRRNPHSLLVSRHHRRPQRRRSPRCLRLLRRSPAGRTIPACERRRSGPRSECGWRQPNRPQPSDLSNPTGWDRRRRRLFRHSRPQRPPPSHPQRRPRGRPPGLRRRPSQKMSRQRVAA